MASDPGATSAARRRSLLTHMKSPTPNSSADSFIEYLSTHSGIKAVSDNLKRSGINVRAFIERLSALGTKSEAVAPAPSIARARTRRKGR